MILAKFNGRHDNCGDKLIFTCLCQQLGQYDELYILGEMPTAIQSNAKGSLRLRHALCKVAYLRFKGVRSKLFYPPGAHFTPKVRVAPSIREKLHDKLVLILWKLLGCSIHITGISLGDNFDSEHYLRFRSVGVRDRESLLALKEHHHNVSLCPDMAFLRPVHPPKTEVSSAIFSFRSETPDDGYRPGYELELEHRTRLILEIFERKNIEANFFSNVNEDNIFNRHLSKKYFSEGFRTSFLSDSPDNLDYKSYFENFGIVVSNRLHVLLPAMSEGLLPMALVSSRHYKIIRLFKTFGLEKFLLYTDGPESDFINEVKSLLEKRSELTLLNYNNLINLRRDVLNYFKSVV